MALTWYVGHIVVGLGAVIALGLVGNQTLLVAFAWGLGFVVVAFLSSWAWKSFSRPGPLEWLRRKVAAYARFTRSFCPPPRRPGGTRASCA